MTKSEHWITGIHAVTQLLQRRPQDIVRLLINADRADKRLSAVRKEANSHQVLLEELSPEELERACPQAHQGVAALTTGAKPEMTEKQLLEYLANLEHPVFLLVLDGITDPHNLGACLRSADAAGVDAVIIPKDKSVGLTPTVSHVASGAAESVNLVTVTNLSRTLKALQAQNIWLVGTDDEAEVELFQQDLNGNLALVMGSEGVGLRRLTRECCDFLVSIPMAGAVSSLNVSVATGIALFEAVRQRRCE